MHMFRIQRLIVAVGSLMALSAAWGQPVGAVRGRGEVMMNGRMVERGSGATYLKAGDEVRVSTGKAVLDLTGGTRLYLDAGARVKLEKGAAGTLGVRVLEGAGAYRLGEGASLEGVSGPRQGLLLVERTLARVYPMVTMATVQPGETTRAATTVPPMLSVDVSPSSIPPTVPAVGRPEAPAAPQQQPLLPVNVAPGTVIPSVQSYFTASSGQPPAPTIVPGGSAFITISAPGGGQSMTVSQLRNDEESLWWLGGGGKRNGEQ